MSTDKGYVRIYRDIWDHWLWDDRPVAKGQAWIDLVMMANHEDKKIMFDGKPTIVKRGEIITSIRSLAVRWGWSRNKVSRFLSVLEDDMMLHQKRDSKKTTLNIDNYALYQGSRDSKKATEKPVKSQSKATEKPQTDHSRATDGHKQYTKEYTKESTKEDTKKKPPISPTEADLFPPEDGWYMPT